MTAHDRGTVLGGRQGDGSVVSFCLFRKGSNALLAKGDNRTVPLSCPVMLLRSGLELREALKEAPGGLLALGAVEERLEGGEGPDLAAKDAAALVQGDRLTVCL